MPRGQVVETLHHLAASRTGDQARDFGRKPVLPPCTPPLKSAPESTRPSSPVDRSRVNCPAPGAGSAPGVRQRRTAPEISCDVAPGSTRGQWEGCLCPASTRACAPVTVGVGCGCYLLRLVLACRGIGPVPALRLARAGGKEFLLLRDVRQFLDLNEPLS